jgi:hypothetical protein
MAALDSNATTHTVEEIQSASADMMNDALDREGADGVDRGVDCGTPTDTKPVDKPAGQFNQHPQQQQQPEPERQPAATGEAYKLEAPADVAGKATPDDLTALGGFASAAHGAGVPQSVAQAGVEAFTDALAAFANVNVDEHTDAYEAESHMRRIWNSQGEYDAQMKKVNAAVRSLGDGFRRWLDDSNSGNDPRVLVALANYDVLRMSKERAAAELKQLMTSKEYHAGNKIAVLRSKALARVAYRGDRSMEQQLNDAVGRGLRRSVETNTSTTPGAVAKSQQQASLRAEAAKLLGKDSDLMRGGPGKAAALRRFQEITKALSNP